MLFTSFFMEYSVFLFVFVWCGLGLVADITDGISIENCGSGSIDIRENAENSITCKDFAANANVTWYIKRSGTSSSAPIATCTPLNCMLHLQTCQFTVQRSSQESQLVYRQQNRTEDIRARIICESKVLSGSSSWNTLHETCDLNLISPAVLSGCVVEEDRDNGTVNGSCHFEHAFISAKREFACTWQQTTSSGQPTVRHSGNVNKEEYTSNGQEYWRGLCSLFIRGQQWDDGDYSYSVDFYPGSGPLPVPIKGSASTVPTSTSTPVSSQSTSSPAGTTEGSSGPGVTSSSSVTSSTPGPSQPTATTAAGTAEGPGVSSSSSVTSSPPGPSQSTASTAAGITEGLSNDPDTDDDSLPIAAIAGGAVAAVVVIIVVVVVIVVVVTRRRQRRKPAETPHTSRENDYWEEHINAAYVSCGGNDDDNDDHDASLDHHQPPSPTSTTAINTDNDDNTDAASRLYGSEDGDHDTDPNKTDPITDTYAVVDKSKKWTDPNRNATGPGSKPVTDTYAVVDKSKKWTDPNGDGAAPVTDTYAVVDKSRKRNAPPRNGPVQDSAADDYSEAEPEGDPYSHLQLSSPAVKPVKPVPPKKPTLKAEVTQSAASDDVYNKLNFN